MLDIYVFMYMYIYMRVYNVYIYACVLCECVCVCVYHLSIITTDKSCRTMTDAWCLWTCTVAVKKKKVKNN